MPVYIYETIPEHDAESPRQFEWKQSMKEVSLTHDPETGRRVRRVIQSGFLNTQRWTKSPGVVIPKSASDGHCCGVSGCGPH